MFRKMLFLTMMASTLIGIALLIPVGTGRALAQEELPLQDSSCRDCHEDQYYLYDSGSWYCLRETKVSCTECHSGHPDMTLKECAHEGLIANPLVNDAAVCQSCHPDDYQSRVQTYASVAGLRPTPRPYATYVPPAPASSSQSGESPDSMRLQALPGARQGTGISFFGVVFLGLFIFVCRCWKTDHSTRSKE